MKKFLLAAFALCAAMSMNAQNVVIGLIDSEVLYNYEENADGKFVLPAGTVLGTSDITDCSNLYEDAFGTSSLSYGLVVNGEEVDKVTAVQGNTNGPSTAAGADGVYPESGCIYKFHPNADGYMYIIHKGSYNKNYVVFEDRDRLPYYFSMYDSSNDVFGSFNLYNVDGATYHNDQFDEDLIASGYAILTPQDYDPALAAATSGGVSVIMFPVIADVDYLAFATGSKMTLGYFIYSDTPIEIRSARTTDEVSYDVVLCDAGSLGEAGIEGIEATKTIVLDGNTFNIAGQRVSKDTKGIVIQDGKKYVNK